MSLASSGSDDVEHLLALARRSDDLVLRHDEAVAAGRSDQQLAPRLVGERVGDVVVLFEVDHQAHRLALPAPARQQRSLQREDLAVGREQQQLVGGRTP